jgi:hypothetical protein
MGEKNLPIDHKKTAARRPRDCRAGGAAAPERRALCHMGVALSKAKPPRLVDVQPRPRPPAADWPKVHEEVRTAIKALPSQVRNN